MSLWTSTESRAREASVDHDVKTATKNAYERGRRDERAARKRHPFIMTLLFLLAIAGASFITLAVMNGSFSGGGAVADHQIAVAAPAVQGAVSTAGQAAETASTDVVQKTRDLTSRAKN
jgi:hypothetical protein